MQLFPSSSGVVAEAIGGVVAQTIGDVGVGAEMEEVSFLALSG